MKYKFSLSKPKDRVVEAPNADIAIEQLRRWWFWNAPFKVESMEEVKEDSKK